MFVVMLLLLLLVGWMVGCLAGGSVIHFLLRCVFLEGVGCCHPKCVVFVAF